MSDEHNRSQRSARDRYRDIHERTEIQRERFYELVMKAIDSLPPVFQDKMENVDVIVTDWPSPAQLARSNIRSRYGLLGLYEGIPQTRRGRGYGMVIPDKITIFRKPIEARCRSWSDVEEEVGKVVRHEIAHHFGIDDDTLRSIEGSR
jgi:predicted Zn-dependent protease with MMP-like domain